MTVPSSVVIVGESIAGITAARELRTRGYDGPVTIVGAEPHGAYSRPPLSKQALRDGSAESGLAYRYDDLDLHIIRERATALDVKSSTVATLGGHTLPYGALIVATGASPRRLALPGQGGEIVLRSLDDARLLRARIAEARTAVVVGAGFLGMEVASACVSHGLEVTVVDVEPPLYRVLGPFLSEQIALRLVEHGVRLVRASGPVGLSGEHVNGVSLPHRSTLNADLVVTCAGDLPATEWLANSALANRHGIAIDDRCRTAAPTVFAAGDVAYLAPADGRSAARAPFWSNAVAQAKVAAAAALGQQPSCRPRDDYFWTEILDLPIKVIGSLPVHGEPTTVEGNLVQGNALLRWEHVDGSTTTVAYGKKLPVSRLRAMA